MNKEMYYLWEFANHIGEINEMLCYSSGFFTAEGVAADGKKFSITLHIKEEEENA